MEEKWILTTEYEKYLAEVWQYRQEFLDSADTIDGGGPLRRSGSAEEWLELVRSYTDPATLPEGRVLATQFLCVRGSDGRLLGMLQLRHYLNDYLEKYAGHIGYSVRPSERRRGVAKWMLASVLPRARELGLDRVLITCDDDNEGSRRTILANGGIYENTVFDPEDQKNRERYWVPVPCAGDGKAVNEGGRHGK